MNISNRIDTLHTSVVKTNQIVHCQQSCPAALVGIVLLLLLLLLLCSPCTFTPEMLI